MFSLLAMDRKAAWLLDNGDGKSMEKVAGRGDHSFPRRCQDTQSPCSSPLGICNVASQPPLLPPNLDEIGSCDTDVLSFLLES